MCQSSTSTCTNHRQCEREGWSQSWRGLALPILTKDWCMCWTTLTLKTSNYCQGNAGVCMFRGCQFESTYIHDTVQGEDYLAMGASL